MQLCRQKPDTLVVLQDMPVVQMVPGAPNLRLLARTVEEFLHRSDCSRTLPKPLHL